jgi:hypothetical protein
MCDPYVGVAWAAMASAAESARKRIIFELELFGIETFDGADPEQVFKKWFESEEKFESGEKWCD